MDHRGHFGRLQPGGLEDKLAIGLATARMTCARRKMKPLCRAPDGTEKGANSMEALLNAARLSIPELLQHERLWTGMQIEELREGRTTKRLVLPIGGSKVILQQVGPSRDGELPTIHREPNPLIVELHRGSAGGRVEMCTGHDDGGFNISERQLITPPHVIEFLDPSTAHSFRSLNDDPVLMTAVTDEREAWNENAPARQYPRNAFGIEGLTGQQRQDLFKVFGEIYPPR